MSDTTNRIAGTALLTIDGATTLLRGKFAYDPSTTARDIISGQDNPVHGYKEMPRAGSIKMTLTDWAGLSVQQISDITNSTISCTLANGKIVIGRNMVRVGDGLEVDTEEGTLEPEFRGIVTEN